MSTTTQPDPWAALAAHPDIRLHITSLPPGIRGLTDGHSTIWLSDRLTQRERRCTLMHELIHIRHKHRGHQPESVEEAVRRETARIMLPDISRIADALAAGTPWDAADTLWVTDDLLRARLQHLHPSERAYLQARAEHLTDGIAA